MHFDSMDRSQPAPSNFLFPFQLSLVYAHVRSVVLLAHFLFDNWLRSIVLQLTGSKRWALYSSPPIVWPARVQKFKPLGQQPCLETIGTTNSLKHLEFMLLN